MFLAIHVPPYSESIRLSFPRSGSSRAEVVRALPSGEVRELLRVCFDEAAPRRTVSAVYVADEFMANQSRVDNPKRLSGLTPELLTSMDESIR